MNSISESSARPCRMMSDVARLSLATSAGCFAAAGFGCVLNQFVPNAISAEGFAIVGCFFLVIGVVDHSRVRWLESRRQQITESENSFHGIKDE